MIDAAPPHSVALPSPAPSPRPASDAMVKTLRGIGRDVGDIAAWLTTWDFSVLAATTIRAALEEAPQGFNLLRSANSPAYDGRRLEQMTRTAKILGRQLGLAGR